MTPTKTTARRPPASSSEQETHAAITSFGAAFPYPGVYGRPLRLGLLVLVVRSQRRARSAGGLKQVASCNWGRVRPKPYSTHRSSSSQ